MVFLTTNDNVVMEASMRALVVSIWVFINLVFFGMCGYMYLLWSQYWMYIENQTSAVTFNYDQQIYYYNRGYPPGYFNETSKYSNSTDKKRRIKHATKENPVTIIKNSKPRFPSTQNVDFKMDNPSFRCLQNDSTNECDIKNLGYKEQIFKEMNRVFMEESNVLRNKNKNPYNLQYNGSRGNFMNKNSREILCLFKDVKIKTIKRTDYPFSRNIFKEYLPRKNLFENKRFETCAIVASAGSLKNSHLGSLIDSHNVVLRFNHAPTEGFAADVGEKTTFRILNSQVVTKPEFQFLQSELYQNITLLAWDPSNFTATLEDWFQQPEFNLFPNYLEHRRKHRKTKFFLLNPRSLWDLWTFLQKNSPGQLRRNPPSSGFLGLAVLLPHCDYVDMFEYIPSVRVTRKCHYYDAEENPACTFGVWHPLAAEKLLSYSLNVASDRTVFQTGYIRIPGFKKVHC